MAALRRKKRRRKRKKSALDYIALPRLPRLDLDDDTRKGVFIIFILALGAISALSLLDMAGAMGGYISEGLVFAFGWGKWILPLVLLVWGYLLYDDERFSVGAGNYLGLFIFIIAFHALLFLVINQEMWPKAIANGQGGGYIGVLVAGGFIKFMGVIASFVVDICLLIVSILLMFNTTLGKLFGREGLAAKFFYPLTFILAKLFRAKPEKNREDEKDEEEEKDEDEEKETVEMPHLAAPDAGEVQHSVAWWEPTGIKINLPIKLLHDNRGKPTSGDIKASKEIIERDLENFGVPVEMGDVMVGPTVTQYTFRPADGIKLSKITNLSNDLALALAAHPIRIEAPIPGKSLVGVEVPNQIKAIVGLKEALVSKRFRERKTNLTVALGKDVSGRPWFDDIGRMPHLLVAGATNSGKSVCLNAIIVSLLYQNDPDDLRFIMVDPKRVELPVYNGIPYLLTPVITDVNKTINALRWCLNEMDRRFEILSKSGQRNIDSFNNAAKVKMPYIIFVVDELADLMVAAGRDIEAGVIRLAQMARAVGIHLILATQRPSVDVITGLIKANMPARIAFSVASGVDSRTILDTLGAEKLLGRGDMLYENSEMSKPKRLQGAFVSDAEIRKIVKFIKEKGGKAEYNENITEKQKVHGIGGAGLEGGDDEDELLEEARGLIINAGRASASFLQRRLSIGYARAARILDLLEEAGVVGPSNGAKPREIMISREQYERMAEQGVSGVSLHRREEAEAPDEYLEDDEGPEEASKQNAQDTKEKIQEPKFTKTPVDNKDKQGKKDGDDDFGLYFAK